MEGDSRIQKLLFESIRQRLPAHFSLVHEIAEILGISYDSAYRRLRGDKCLSIEEMKILSHKYKISVDSILGLTQADVLFQPFALNHKETGFEEWLKLRLQLVQALKAANVIEVIIVARDLPVYFLFDFPELVAFKLFFWKKMLTHHREYHDVLFNSSMIPQDLMGIGQKLLSLYNDIPTVEIWCIETFVRIMQQIEFCHESGFFMHNSDINTLFRVLETMIRHIQYQTEFGIKYRFGEKRPDAEPENLKVFFNEVLVMDNTVYIEKDGARSVFMTHNSLDILSTTNPSFCLQVENALKQIMRTGNCISSTSELERNRFFNAIYSKLELYKTGTSNEIFVL